MVLAEGVYPFENTIYSEIRSRIDSVKDYQIKNILRIAYVFGAEPSEYLGKRKTNDQQIRGNDFYQDVINDVDALVVRLPTIRKGGKIREIAVPLNASLEPFSSKILKFSEECNINRIYNTYYEVFWKTIKDIKLFKGINFPVKPYKTRSDKINSTRNFTLTHLTEIRQIELGLCHNFNELDYKLFCGDIFPSDYRIYFSKLLHKSNYYDATDVYNALVLKNTIFNPKSDYKYHYKDYMNIIKLLKRNYLGLTIEDISIDENIGISDLTASKSGNKDHKILMANITNILKNKSKNVTTEYENMDVYDIENKIAVECGDTNAKKLLDLFKDRYYGLKDVRKFWIINYWGYPKSSKLYKFYKKVESFR